MPFQRECLEWPSAANRSTGSRDGPPGPMARPARGNKRRPARGNRRRPEIPAAAGQPNGPPVNRRAVEPGQDAASALGCLALVDPAVVRRGCFSRGDLLAHLRERGCQRVVDPALGLLNGL